MDLKVKTISIQSLLFLTSNHFSLTGFDGWGEGITYQEVKEVVMSSKKPLNELFSLDGMNSKNWNKEQHMRRIKYFCEYPEEIKNIYIGKFGAPKKMIVDGNHRVFAALLLDMDKITVVDVDE
jgi:hypothetical protein